MGADVASQTGVSADRVLISSISGGSAVVAFSVTPAADGAPLAADTLTAAFAGAVSLPSVGASTTAAVSTPTVSDAAPTAAEMATLQAHVAALPSGADITALQMQVTQLMGAHFMCAAGARGSPGEIPHGLLTLAAVHRSYLRYCATSCPDVLCTEPSACFAPGAPTATAASTAR